jgi:hypothetical protein
VVQDHKGLVHRVPADTVLPVEAHKALAGKAPDYRTALAEAASRNTAGFEGLQVPYRSVLVVGSWVVGRRVLSFDIELVDWVRCRIRSIGYEHMPWRCKSGSSEDVA